MGNSSLSLTNDLQVCPTLVGSAYRRKPAVSLGHTPLPVREADAVLARRYRFAQKTLIERQGEKFRRAMSRWYRGQEVNPERLLLVTLSTPEGKAIPIHRAWRLFLWRMRKAGLKREYFAVREWNKKHTCVHIHAVFRTDEKLDAGMTRDCWTAACGVASGLLEAGYRSDEVVRGLWTEHEWVRDESDMATYMGKYLAKGLILEPKRKSFWYSGGWICRRYISFSKAMWCAGKPVDVGNVKLLRALDTPYVAMLYLLLKARASGDIKYPQAVERELFALQIRTNLEVGEGSDYGGCLES